MNGKSDIRDEHDGKRDVKFCKTVPKDSRQQCKRFYLFTLNNMALKQC